MKFINWERNVFSSQLITDSFIRSIYHNISIISFMKFINWERKGNFNHVQMQLY